MHEHQDIILLGAGGHAKVCIDILHAMGETVAYCVGADDRVKTCLGIPVLSGDEKLVELRHKGFSRFFVALGPNHLRVKLARMGHEAGFELVNAISPKAIVSDSAKLGLGVAIMPGAVINAEAEIADLAIINTGATVDHDCRIGHGAHIGPQCALAGCVWVGPHSFLGVGCKVIPEIKIGTDCLVAAGSVLIRHVDDGCRVCGVPAKNMVLKTNEEKRG